MNAHLGRGEEPHIDVSDLSFEEWDKEHPWKSGEPVVYWVPRWLEEARLDSGRFHWCDLVAACWNRWVLGLVVVWAVSTFLALWFCP